MRVRVSSLLVGVALVLGAAEARGQGTPPVSDQMLAQSLFEEGRQLMDRGRYADACPKLAESQRLDPGGGTLLNLAICHEKEGRVGTAYLEMKSAASQAAKDGRKDREKLANEHLGFLSSRVPRLAIHVVREEPSLDVRIDGTVLRKPAWDLLTVVDPGPHVIDAAAPGKAPFRQTITLAEGEQRTVQIPALDASNGTAAPGPAPVIGGAAGGPAATAPGVKPEMRTNPWFIASVATGVTGFAIGLPAAYVWGMMKVLESTCRPLSGVGGSSSFFCVSDSVQNTWFAVAAVGLAVGVAGTIGLVAFPSKIQVAPTATAHGGGAVVLGTF